MVAIATNTRVPFRVNGLTAEEASRPTCGADLQRLLGEVPGHLKGYPKAEIGGSVIRGLPIVSQEQEGIRGRIMAQGEAFNFELQADVASRPGRLGR